MERYEILYETIKKVVEVESMTTRLEKTESTGRAKMALKALRKKF